MTLLTRATVEAASKMWLEMHCGADPLVRGCRPRRPAAKDAQYLSPRGKAGQEAGCGHLRGGVNSFYIVSPFLKVSFWKPAQEIHWIGISNGDG